MAYSGKFVLRVGSALHERLKKEAMKKGVSLNQNVLSYLTEDKDVSRPETQMVQTVSKMFQPIGILQFGSTTQGRAREGSDIDLLIVLDSQKDITRDLYQDWERASIPKVYSPHFVHLPKNDKPSSLWLEASLFGRLLVESDSVEKAVTKIKEDIAQGLWVRKLTHGQPYWIKKEVA